MKQGFIRAAEPGNCPWASPTVCAWKSDCTIRVCVDYRILNEHNVKDAYPLPNIQIMRMALWKMKIGATLDLASGYYQIGVNEKDQYLTAFITHKGLYIYVVMPFVLYNAPATFQRAMDLIFGSRIGVDMTVYMDDLCNFALTAEALLDSLHRTFATLGLHGLVCKPAKCKLFQEEIHYLGYRVRNGTIYPDEKKIEKVRAWPFPQTGVQMQSFLGLCNYYRDLIQNYSGISDPLYKVDHNTDIEKTAELEERFDQLKSAIIANPVVRLPDVQKPFIVETDASQIAIGAVLKQRDDDGTSM